MVKKILRGDIVYAVLPKQSGSIQSGTRPCIIVSNDISNMHSSVVNLLPLTTKMKYNPVHVKITSEDIQGYLVALSYSLAEQIVTRNKNEIISKIGHLSEDTDVMKRINKSIEIQLGLSKRSKEER